VNSETNNEVKESSSDNAETSSPNAGETTVIALFEYSAAEEGELSFDEGEELIILDYDATDDSGWWEAKRKNGDTGLIPSNYVQPRSASPPEKASANGNSAASPTQSKPSAKVDSPPPSADRAPDSPSNFTVKAIKKYAGKEKDSLGFKKGAVIEVLEVNPANNTYYGTLGKKKGWFPSFYVVKQ